MRHKVTTCDLYSSDPACDMQAIIIYQGQYHHGLTEDQLSGRLGLGSRSCRRISSPSHRKVSPRNDQRAIFQQIQCIKTRRHNGPVPESQPMTVPGQCCCYIVQCLWSATPMLGLGGITDVPLGWHTATGIGSPKRGQTV